MLRPALLGLASLPLLALYGGACSDSTPVVAPVDAGAPALGTGSATSVAITVTGLRGLVAGVPVVFHDAKGNVLQTAQTGPDGTAFSDVIGVGMVTAVVQNGPQRRLVTWTHVESGDRLQLRDALTSETVATYDVTTPRLAGGGQVNVYLGGCTAWGTSGKALSITVTPACVGAAPVGLFAFATKTDGSGSFATFLANAPTVPLDGSHVSATITNPWKEVPQTYGQGGAIAGGLLYDLATGVPGFGEAQQATVTETVGGEIRGVVVRGPYEKNFHASLTDALPPLATPKIDATNGARPLVRWAADADAGTAAGPLTFDGGLVNLVYDLEGQSSAWTFVVAPGATQIAAPALPAEIAAYVPASDGSVYEKPAVVLFDSTTLDPRTFREQQGVLFQPWTTTKKLVTMPVLAADGELRFAGHVAD